MGAWNPEANDLFLRALEIQADDQRRAFLDEECAADARLRSQAEALLDAHERAGNFLESPARGLGAAALAQHVTEAIGTMVGPYKLREQIGEGGGRVRCRAT